ncbi:MAG: acyl-CoA dehydrogenase family protein [Rhodospirillales bacterium]|nr:acyl-CoA dehydrogenase family protein [Rhodospirillales bacterium]
MDDITAMVLQTARGLMQRASSPAALRAAEDGAFDHGAWQAVTEAGLTLAMAAEDAGGAGLAPEAAMRIARVAGETALPLPLPETMLAIWLAGRAGLALPRHILEGGVLGFDPTGTAAALQDGDILTTLARIPWGRAAVALLLPALRAGEFVLVLLDRTAWTVAPGTSIAKEPRDTLQIDTRRAGGTVLAVMPSPVSALALRGYGAALRCQQIAGALAAITAMTTQYAQERSQFGRPIGRFQAVQQNLAVLAGQTAAALAAADIAAEALDRPEPEALIAIAAAKTRAGEAAGIGAAIAHQVHGAIGFTMEHRLHFLTRRLWSWREECGKEGEWAIRLGRHLAAQGAERLWAEITAA